jgi:hypothetical protein
LRPWACIHANKASDPATTNKPRDSAIQRPSPESRRSELKLGNNCAYFLSTQKSSGSFYALHAFGNHNSDQPTEVFETPDRSPKLPPDLCVSHIGLVSSAHDLENYSWSLGGRVVDVKMGIF